MDVCPDQQVQAIRTAVIEQAHCYLPPAPSAMDECLQAVRQHDDYYLVPKQSAFPWAVLSVALVVLVALAGWIRRHRFIEEEEYDPSGIGEDATQ
jgi:hypothetical protein